MKSRGLEDKFKALLDIQGKIKKIRANKDTLPSERLLDQRGYLEAEISRHLVNGEILGDSFMDYCLRRFNGSTTININGENERNPSVFDIVPEVKSFMSYIGKNKGQKILSTYDGISAELGVIDGKCRFEVIDRCYRHLYVPVRQLWEFNSTHNKWEQKKEMFYVNPDIFSHPGLCPAFNNGKGWTTDHSTETYIGGPGPKETSIYVGDKEVNAVLKRSRRLTIPAKEIDLAPAPEI